jgi:hypothetical protein
MKIILQGNKGLAAKYLRFAKTKLVSYKNASSNNYVVRWLKPTAKIRIGLYSMPGRIDVIFIAAEKRAIPNAILVSLSLGDLRYESDMLVDLWDESMSGYIVGSPVQPDRVFGSLNIDSGSVDTSLASLQHALSGTGGETLTLTRIDNYLGYTRGTFGPQPFSARAKVWNLDGSVAASGAIVNFTPGASDSGPGQLPINFSFTKGDFYYFGIELSAATLMPDLSHGPGAGSRPQTKTLLDPAKAVTVTNNNGIAQFNSLGHGLVGNAIHSGFTNPEYNGIFLSDDITGGGNSYEVGVPFVGVDVGALTYWIELTVPTSNPKAAASVVNNGGNPEFQLSGAALGSGGIFLFNESFANPEYNGLFDPSELSGTSNVVASIPFVGVDSGLYRVVDSNGGLTIKNATITVQDISGQALFNGIHGLTVGIDLTHTGFSVSSYNGRFLASDVNVLSPNTYTITGVAFNGPVVGIALLQYFTGNFPLGSTVEHPADLIFSDSSYNHDVTEYRSDAILTGQNVGDWIGKPIAMLLTGFANQLLTMHPRKGIQFRIFDSIFRSSYSVLSAETFATVYIYKWTTAGALVSSVSKALPSGEDIFGPPPIPGNPVFWPGVFTLDIEFKFATGIISYTILVARTFPLVGIEPLNQGEISSTFLVDGFVYTVGIHKTSSQKTVSGAFFLDTTATATPHDQREKPSPTDLDFGREGYDSWFGAKINTNQRECHASLPAFVSNTELLLLNMQGDDGSEIFNDSSGNNRQVTSVNGASILNNRLSLTSGNDYLEILNSQDWDFFQDVFTVELFIQASNANSSTLISHNTDSGNTTIGWSLNVESNSITFVGGHTNSLLRFQIQATGIAPLDGNLHHIALSHFGFTWVISMDGVTVEEFVDTFSFLYPFAVNAASVKLLIGTVFDSGLGDMRPSFQGSVGRVEINRGLAKYHGTYQVPTL